MELPNTPSSMNTWGSGISSMGLNLTSYTWRGWVAGGSWSPSLPGPSLTQRRSVLSHQAVMRMQGNNMETSYSSAGTSQTLNVSLLFSSIITKRRKCTVLLVVEERNLYEALENRVWCFDVLSIAFWTVQTQNQMYRLIAMLCVCVLSPFSHLWLFATPWTVAYQANIKLFKL